ncbi:NodT family efflux transporter outer membrane factor (OMF) lipoprotein [Bradyrhizobium sp. LM6.10]
MLCLAAGSGACVLTQDLPDPALDVPTQYKYAGKADAPPTLDWWRGFRSPELTQLMEEAHTVNLDIAAAVARIVQADAQARQAGAALLPSLSGGGSETYSRTSGSSSSGLTNGGREVVNYSASLSASYQLDFWGQNRDALQTAEETANANRFDRDVVALTTLAGVANAYFQVLASQDRLRTAQRNIASAQRILDAIRERRKAGTGTDLDVAQQESVLANQKALVPPLRQTLDQNVNALAVLVSRPPESVRVLGGSLNNIAIPRVTPGLPSELLTQRPDIRRQEAQLASATANIGNARAQFFPTIQLTGKWRLSEFSAGVAVPAACGVLPARRQRGAADLRRRQDPRQFRICQGAAGRIAPDLPQDHHPVVCRCRQCAVLDQADYDQAAIAA